VVELLEFSVPRVSFALTTPVMHVMQRRVELTVEEFALTFVRLQCLLLSRLERPSIHYHLLQFIVVVLPIFNALET
jgi:hypothetical protein